MPTKEEKQYWKKHYAHLIGEFYPDPIHCHCPDHCRIKIQSHHHQTGIPKWVKGHCKGWVWKNPHPKKGKTVEEYFGEEKGKDVRAKNSASHVGKSNKHKGKVHSTTWNENISKSKTGKHLPDFTKETRRLDMGLILTTGPEYWKSFRDFVVLGCRLYHTQYLRISPFIRKELKKQGLERLDINLFLNWNIGHTQQELAEKYHISIEEVLKRLKHIREVYPGVFQEQVTIPDIAWMLQFQWEEGDERVDIIHKF